MNTAAFWSKAVILQANKERICCIYIIMYKLKNMKAMYKSELAAYAGVTTRTLRRWLKPYQQQLAELGMKPKDQIVKPSAVKFICETLCIDIYP